MNKGQNHPVDPEGPTSTADDKDNTKDKEWIQSNLKKVRELVTPLGRDQKIRLHDLISGGALQQAIMERPIVRLLVEQMNGARSEHARRLWTSWFEEILLRDDLSLLARQRLPGSLHVVDAGAWWMALAGRLASLSDKIQRSIGELSQDVPLERIYASPEVVQWREELRQQTLDIFLALRANGASLTRFIADANGHRDKLIKLRRLPVSSQFSLGDFDILEEMLNVAPAWNRLSSLGPTAAAVNPGDLARFCERLAYKENGGMLGAALLLLGHIHSHRDAEFASTLHYLRRLPVFRAAVVAHLQLATDLMLHAVNEQYLAKPGPFPSHLCSHPISVYQAKFLAWYDAAHVLELNHDAGIWSVGKQAIGSVMDLLETMLVPMATAQMSALTPQSPFLSVIELVEFVQTLLTQFGKRGIAVIGNPWAPALGAHLGEIFRFVSLQAAQEVEYRQSLLCLGRVAYLSELIGQSVEVSAINSSLVGVVVGALRDRKRFDAVELYLIDRVVTKAQEERRRSKWWITPEVGELLDFVEKTKITATAAKAPVHPPARKE